MCSSRYAACNVHAPYCHLWPASLHNIFPHYLINGTIFGKKKSYWTWNVLSIFSTTFVWNIFHSKKKWGRYDQYWYSCKVPRYSCPILIFLDRFSKNTQILYFMKVPPMGVKFFHHADRWTDGRTNMTKLIVAFRSFVKAPKIKKNGRCSGLHVILQCLLTFLCQSTKKNYSLIHVGFKTIWQIG